MLYFLHGYQSSPNSEKATLLKKTLNVIPIKYRDNAPENLVISNALLRISTIIQNDNQVILIGSSLGGFLAVSTALTNPNVKRLILLNPAIIPPDVDIHSIQGIPSRILNEMKNSRLFEHKISIPITILRGTHDKIVPDYWILSFAKAQNATIQLYDDDHRFTKNLQNLPKLITEII